MIGLPHILLTTDAVGGQWTYALDLGGGLIASGARVTLACLGPSPQPAQQADAAARGLTLIDTGLPLDWLAPDAPAVQRAGEALARLCDEAGADLLHLNQPALAAGIRFPVPVLGGCHSCLGTWWQAVHPAEPMPAELGWRVERLARGLAACDALLAPSRDFARRTARVHGLAPHILWNGRDAPPPLPPSLGRRPVALSAGRLWDKGKGMAALDRAAARMRHRVEAAGPREGPGGEAISLRNVSHLGNLAPAALASAMRDRALFVSLATYEPFGLAVLEAAQHGMALVLADTPVFRELWGDAALFTDPDDTDATAALLDSLLEDRTALARLGAAAHRRARRYALGPMVAGTAALYRQLIDGSRGRAGAPHHRAPAERVPA